MAAPKPRRNSAPWLALLVLVALPMMAPAAPELVLDDLDGRTHRISDYRGKWVLVNYWATWCPPCLEELPELEIFYATHKDKDAVVLGVNMEDIASDALRRFVEEQSLSYPILRQEPSGRTVFGPIEGMPTSFLVSPEGELVARQEGRVTAQAIEDFIAGHRSQRERPQQ